MFDFDVGKLLLIGVVALIFIPPKDLPQALRQLGRLLGQARRMASDFRAQFDEALRESDLHDLKDEFANLKQKASVEGTMNRIADMIDVDHAVKAQESPPRESPAPGQDAPGVHEPPKAERQLVDERQPIEKSELPPPPAATEIKP